MKNQALLSVAAMITILLSGVLFYIPNTDSGCGSSPPCCPIIESNSLVYPKVICHPDCPGGGRVDVYGNLKFLREGEICDPDAGFTFYVRNITDQIDYPAMEINKDTKSGLYNFKSTFTLNHNAEFEIRGKGVNDCGKANVKFEIKVLIKGGSYVDNLLFSEKKPTSKLIWSRHLTYGTGIVLETIENRNKFRVDVEINNGSKIPLDKADDQKDFYEFQPTINATGNYTISIPENQASIYNSIPNPIVDLALRVRCDCQ